MPKINVSFSPVKGQKESFVAPVDERPGKSAADVADAFELADVANESYTNTQFEGMTFGYSATESGLNVAERIRKHAKIREKTTESGNRIPELTGSNGQKK